MAKQQMAYRPALWEKITTVVVVIGIIGSILYLVLTDAKFTNPNTVVLARILLSLAVAVLGATVPGFLGIDLTAKGLSIRSGGALALFVITYFFTPSVVAAPLASSPAAVAEPAPGIQEVTFTSRTHYDHPFGFAYSRDAGGMLRKVRALPAFNREMHDVIVNTEPLAPANGLREAYRLVVANPSLSDCVVEGIVAAVTREELPARYVCVWDQKGLEPVPRRRISLPAASAEVQVLNPDEVLRIGPRSSERLLAEIADSPPGSYSIAFKTSVMLANGQIRTIDGGRHDVFVPGRLPEKELSQCGVLLISNGVLNELAERVLALSEAGFDALRRKSNPVAIDLGNVALDDLLNALKLPEAEFLAWVERNGNRPIESGEIGSGRSFDESWIASARLQQRVRESFAPAARAEYQHLIGQAHAAVRTLRDALLANESDTTARKMLIEYLLEQGETAEAVSLWEAWLPAEDRWQSRDFFSAGFMISTRVRDFPHTSKLVDDFKLQWIDDGEVVGSALVYFQQSGRYRDALDTIRASAGTLMVFDRDRHHQRLRTGIMTLIVECADRDPQTLEAWLNTPAFADLPAIVRWDIRVCSQIWHAAPLLRLDADLRQVVGSEALPAALALIGSGRIDLAERLLRTTPRTADTVECVGDLALKAEDFEAAFTAYLEALGLGCADATQFEAIVVKAALALARRGDWNRNAGDLNTAISSSISNLQIDKTTLLRINGLVGITQALYLKDHDWLRQSMATWIVSDARTSRGTRFMDNSLGLERVLKEVVIPEEWDDRSSAWFRFTAHIFAVPDGTVAPAQCLGYRWRDISDPYVLGRIASIISSEVTEKPIESFVVRTRDGALVGMDMGGEALVSTGREIMPFDELVNSLRASHAGAGLHTYLERQPINPEDIYRKGLAVFDQEYKTTEAMELVVASIERAPTNVLAHMSAASLCLVIGDKAKARFYLASAEALDPAHPRLAGLRACARDD